MQHLTQSIFVKNLELKNRLVMPPMASARSGQDGSVTPFLCSYYEERAHGGNIGLVITEHAFISPEGRASAGQLSVAEDTLLPGLARLAETLHRNHTPVFVQLNHAGSKASKNDCPAVGPSAGAGPLEGAFESDFQELSPDGIAGLADKFRKAALRAKQAGFDGVELHAAHGYLLNQFYSPLTNRRTDVYGGQTLDSRIRFLLETLKAVRGAVGEEYPIAVRLGGCDYKEGGSSIADSISACIALEKAGADLLDISGGLFGYMVSDSREPGYFRDMTAQIKQAVQIPVLLTGGVTTPEQAEKLLAEKAADLIGVGRALLKDPSWADAAFSSPTI